MTNGLAVVERRASSEPGRSAGRRLGSAGRFPGRPPGGDGGWDGSSGGGSDRWVRLGLLVALAAVLAGAGVVSEAASSDREAVQCLGSMAGSWIGAGGAGAAWAVLRGKARS
ncbi:MAG: hypothetical protein M0Z87_12105 [Actinomycetota bacterium]|nr:hypothetical protein [Actinomycetota bacterium]